jgi:hypothetical protein
MEKMSNTITLGQFGEDFFTIMPKRGMPEIMAKGDSLDEIFVEPKKAPNSSCNLRDKLDVENSVGNMIILNEIENLGLVNIPGIGQGVEDSVCVERKVLPMPFQYHFFLLSPQGLSAWTGPGCQHSFLSNIELFSDLF